MYPVHENETGIFQELIRKREINFGQLSYILIKPGCSRGDHYHKRKEEWFCCLKGVCEIEITNIKDGTKRKIILNENKKEFLKINPFENHVVKNLDNNKDCELIIITDEEYNEDDPDTYKIKE